MTETTWQRVWSVVRRIPRGKVATYGDVARLAGLPGRARLVGYAMAALPAGTRVPWHRVVNAAGAISRRAGGAGELEQRALLEREGVRFDWRGRIPLDRHGWRHATRASAKRRPTARGGEPLAARPNAVRKSRKRGSA